MSHNTYYTLGRTGLRVSRLALGTMTFGTEWGWGMEKAAAQNIFNAYLESGGNFIDTADLYTNGTAESWLGDFVAARGVRDQVVLASKFSYSAQPGNPNAGGNGRKNILRAVEGTLKRLKTDYLDLYLLHTWDRLTPAEEVMRTFDDLVRSGKVRHVGLSDVPAWYAARATTIAQLRGYEPVSVLQLEYSLAERNIENEFVDLGAETGAGIMVWSPLASGLLSGKYKASARAGNANEAQTAGRLATTAGSSNPAFQRFNERNWAIVAELEKVAQEAGRSMAQVAVNWAANRPGIASVIVGATRMEQLKDNLGALDFTLAPEHVARLNAVSDPARPFPYSFFGDELQGMLNGGATVGDKHAGYRRDVLVSGRGRAWCEPDRGATPLDGHSRVPQGLPSVESGNPVRHSEWVSGFPLSRE